MRVATSKTDTVPIGNRLGGGLIGAIIFDPGGRALLRWQPLMSLQSARIREVRRSLT